MCSETLLAESLSSAITCLFAVLGKSSTSDVLDQAVMIVKKTHAVRLGVVEQSLYEEARRLVEEIDDRPSEKDSTDTSVVSPAITHTEAGPNPDSITSGTNPGRQTIERFLHELVLALFGSDPQHSHASHASDTESLRRARVKTGSRILQSTMISSSTRETLCQRLTSWLDQEQSQPLRLLIQQGLKGRERTSSVTFTE